MIEKIKSAITAPFVSKSLVTIYDAIIGAICMYAVIHWRYTLEERPVPANIDETASLVFFIACVITWVLTDTHKAIWRFTSLNDVKKLFQAVFFASIIAPAILFFFFNRAEDFPRSVPFIVGPLFFFAATISRMIILFFQNGDVGAIFRGQNPEHANAILIGHEKSLHNYLRDVSRKAGGPGYNIRGLIETGSKHRGRSIRGIPIMGGMGDLRPILEELKSQFGRFPTLIATDPNMDRNKSYKLIRQASEIGVNLVRVSRGRPDTLTQFEAADLIGRDVRELDIEPVRRLISGKRVMVTGAGGTIGSEISRQVAALEPAKLVLVDNSEFNLYEIDRGLKKMFPEQKENLWFPYMADICDIARMREIFETERPEIILHAAAKKHVPLSEMNPLEAIKTNIGGTKYLIQLANEFNAESFTLISTDKAVNPTNIMGATKRIAEMLTIAEGNGNSSMSSCAVRFGNVLASTGSVIPLFEEQIANGGPVTVTHEDVCRYFMTTKEATSLVLQAAALNASEKNDLASIYVLEMGEPVKIAKLARQLIRLRGFVPDRDIQIVYTGLRPGEKIREKLTRQEENLETTYVDGIQRFKGRMSQPNTARMRVEKLIDATSQRDREKIRESLKNLLPCYEPNGTLAIPEPAPPSAKIIPLTDTKKRT